MTLYIRIGHEHAELLARELWPEFRAADLVAQPNHHIYLKLMIEGKVSRPFSAGTLSD